MATGINTRSPAEITELEGRADRGSTSKIQGASQASNNAGTETGPLPHADLVSTLSPAMDGDAQLYVKHVLPPIEGGKGFDMVGFLGDHLVPSKTDYDWRASNRSGRTKFLSGSEAKKAAPKNWSGFCTG